MYRNLLIGLTLLLAGCSTPALAIEPALAQNPTQPPTETAVPLVTATRVPESDVRIDVPEFDDLDVHKRAMKAGFEKDVDAQRDANRYLIVANLNFEPDAVIRASQRVRYTNRSDDTLELIVFRLYANTPALGGRTNVTRVQIGDTEVEPSFSTLSSVMGVPLPESLPPGDSVELIIDFNTTLTRGLDTSYGRFGYVNGVVSATAWYPTLSVYELGRGWWGEMPSPQGDPAYSETGFYDVRLSTPSDFVVAASGTIIDATDNGDGTTTHRDVTGPMRDHAFQASARYGIESQEVDGTTINVVYYTDQRDQPTNGTEESLEYAANSVRAFNEVFGDYPYRELDVAQNPTPSGVEFPGIVQIAERSWARTDDFLERVIAHEVGHQWFYAIVGNNQVEQPYLDESLTSYTEFVYVRAVYPEETAQRYVDSFEDRYRTYIGRGQPDLPLNLPVASYGSYAYGAIIYTKGPLFLVELERQVGREAVYEGLSDYFAAMKYGIATTADLQTALEEASGEDLTALFEEWVGAAI
jgi:hypothetical protein